MRIRLLIICLIFNLISFSQPKNQLIGSYESLFAEAGWFWTTLDLNKDSTFEYRCVGDLTNDHWKGKFFISKDTVKFVYPEYPLYDTIILKGDTLIFPSRSTLGHKPQGFLIGKKNRLYRINEDGTIVKKSYGRSRRRYLFFGKRIMKKASYYLVPATSQ